MARMIDEAMNAFAEMKEKPGGEKGKGNGNGTGPHARAEHENGQKTQQTGGGASEGDAPVAITVRMADVERQELRWLWTGRVAYGKLTLLVGDPGLGKSYLTLEMASRLSTGTPLYGHGTRERQEPVSSLLLALEDDAGDTMRPRLEALGADLTRVHYLRGIRDGESERLPRLDKDLMLLEDAIRATGAGMLVVDPINAYMGKTEGHKDIELRAVLTPLTMIATRTGIAVVAVTHANKGAEGNPLHRVMGSLAYVAAARSVLGMGADPENPARRVLVQIKSNLSALAPNLGFRVVDEGHIVWDSDPTSITPETVFTGGHMAGETEDSATARRDARELLLTVLAHGAVEARSVFEEARQIGISQATLRRAQVDLGIKPQRRTFGPGGKWFWELPEVELTDSEEAGI